MQRQSLGSPGSKHHHGHGAVGLGSKDEALAVEDLKRFEGTSSLPDEEERKPQKHLRSPPSPPHKLVHLIPLLTFICFFVLYLCSHDPSRSDLANFNGFKRSAMDLDSTETRIGEFGRFVELDKGDVVAIRSLRKLQQIGGEPPIFRLHRKLGDF
ncbi:uncharacterized protein LOC131164881 [Malania oleifera]|uniref:uncharacterized protein LOC131164881 n=1 Tax=Malania oleifera TaxID=397392 RepID=UPI0025AE259B|nr:uncharacterized protein LOC131164881 [Malania oleifera]